MTRPDKWTDAEEACFFPELYRHVKCPKCHAAAGERCLSRWDNRTHHVHVQRVLAARDAA